MALQRIGTTGRRTFLKQAVAGIAAFTLAGAGAQAPPFSLKHSLASCMYGTLPLSEILPAIAGTGVECIDLWPKPHGSQREELDGLGHEGFAGLLAQHNAKLGMLTRYDLGPLNLADEIKVASKLGAKLIITGSTRGGGGSLREEVKQFVEQMKPTVALAAEHGVTIGIENHANQLIEAPDALRYLGELVDSEHIGVALAPYHLPQEPALLASLIEDLGPRLVHFYAWEHGFGCHEPMPKAREMQQLPGFGQLDFAPMLAALKRITYAGWTTVFMHPVPRGIPILPTAVETTAAINRSKEYLEACLAASA